MSSLSGAAPKLTIKAANQKYNDFVIDNFDVDWSVMRLKQYLHLNYPNNPDVKTIRLIYSGKQLNDSLILKEFIRTGSEASIIHLVHSMNITNDQPAPTPNLSNKSEAEQTFDSNQATSSRISQPDHAVHGAPTNTMNWRMTQKEQYNQMLAQIKRYYEAYGTHVNPWMSSWIQNAALYSHMNMQYLNSLNANVIPNVNVNYFMPSHSDDIMLNINSFNPIPAENFDQHAPIIEPVQPPANNNQNMDNDIIGEREDDWLGTLHNIVSFMVLFFLIYVYSSFERFIIIFFIATLVILYHNGWLSIQRRIVNNRNEDNQQQNGRQNANNENDANNQQTEIQRPNFISLMFRFFYHFFASLIPERPRGVIN